MARDIQISFTVDPTPSAVVGPFTITKQNYSEGTFTRTSGPNYDNVQTIICTPTDPNGTTWTGTLKVFNDANGAATSIATNVSRSSIAAGYTINGIACGDRTLSVTSTGQCSSSDVNEILYVTNTPSITVQAQNPIYYATETVTATLYFSGTSGQALVEYPTLEIYSVTQPTGTSSTTGGFNLFSGNNIITGTYAIQFVITGTGSSTTGKTARLIYNPGCNT
jgi:hypothetical protein